MKKPMHYIRSTTIKLIFTAITFGGLLFSGRQANAQIVTWDFTPPTVAKGTPAYTSPQPATSSTAGLTVTDLGFSPAIFGDSNGGTVENSLSSAYFNNNAPTTLAEAISDGYYHTFTITVDPGYTLDLSGFSASTWAGTDSGNDYLLTSATGFTSTDSLGDGANVNKYDTSNGGPNGTFPTLTPWTADLSSVASLQDLTTTSGPIEFRIYEVDSDSGYDQGEFTVSLQGTVTATTPEPATYALMLTGAAMLVAFRIRRRI
jgi:hypothetical protein